MKRLVKVLLLTISFLLLTTTASADSGPYGEHEPNLSIMVDKMVTKPGTTNDYVDNLSPSDPRFRPGQEVYFKIKVKNTSDAKLKDVTVKDMLPEFVDPVEGQGDFDEDLREITIDAGDLEVDEQKEFVLKLKVLDQEDLPSDKALICIVNKAVGSNNNVSDEDTAQFCIEKEVKGVTAVPSAGPEQGVALILGQLTLLGTGVLLRRKTS